MIETGRETAVALSVVHAMLGDMSTRSICSRFVGRTAELARLEAALTRVSGGEPGMVVIGGEAGVGKTRLLGQFGKSAAASGALVVEGACVELGGDGLAFAPIAAVLRALLREPRLAPLVAADGRDRELTRLLPELGDAPREPLDGEFSRARLYETMLTLFERLSADRTIVVAIEDLHWADRSTRDLLGFLIRSLGSARVLIVATYRTDEMHRGHPLRPFLAELDRVQGVRRIEVARFSRSEVAEFLHGIYGWEVEHALVSRVFERAEGNAFFTEEIACSIRDHDDAMLSDSLRDLLLIRVERLPEATQRLLRVLAVGGTQVEHRLLAGVAGTSEDELAEMLRPAFTAAVLVPGEGESYRFRHALMCEAIHDDLLPGEHARQHARFAEALENDPSLIGPERWEVEIAHHWSAAHDSPRALPAALRAAKAAAARYAFAEELRMLERVLELWDRVPHEGSDPESEYLELLYDAVCAASNAGDAVRGLALADEGLRLLDETVHPVLAARLLAERSRALWTLGKGDGLDELRRAARLLEPEEFLAERLPIFKMIAVNLMLIGDGDEALEAATATIDLARQLGDLQTELHARTTSAGALIILGRVEEGIQLHREVGEEAERLGFDSERSRVAINLSSWLASIGRSYEAVEVAREELARQTRGRWLVREAMLRANLAEPLIAVGAWEEAAEAIQHGLELEPQGVHSAYLYRMRAQLATARGDYEDAEHDLMRARGLVGTTNRDGQYRLTQRLAEAELAVARGRIADARSVLLDVVSGKVPEGDHRFVWPMLAVIARGEADATERGDTGGAETIARLRTALTELVQVSGLEPLYAALTDAELIRREKGAPDWSGVLATGESLESPQYLLAYLLFRAAESEATNGDRTEAGRKVAKALEIVDGLRAAPLRAELQRLVQRARLPLPTTVDDGGSEAPVSGFEALGLTPREQEVLRLVAQGLTNGQIGGRLFITTKTASVHVSNILAKLGVSGRTEAAAVAHRLGLFDGEGAAS